MTSFVNTNMTRLLAGSELFGALSEEAMQELAAHATLRVAHEKEVIFEKGRPGNEMFAIIHGRVKISSYSEDGKEVIFTILESGDFFGETALLDGQTRSATCTAIEDCQMVVIERRSFTNYIEKYPAVAIHLLSLLSQRLRKADEQMEEISFFPFAARLARKLLTLAAEHGDMVGSKIEIALNISQLELANMVCVSRESVNRELNQWVKDGIISLSPRLIVIEDSKQLQKIGQMYYPQK